MKLTLEELSPYLPYRLQVCFEGGDDKYEMVQLSTHYKGVGLVSENYGDFGQSSPEDVRPILRPLSDLDGYIEYKGKKIHPIKYFYTLMNTNPSGGYNGGIDLSIVEAIIQELKNMAFLNKCGNWHMLPHYVYEKLFEWHFDVFNLIRGGLAVNMNKIKQDK